MESENGSDGPIKTEFAKVDGLLIRYAVSLKEAADTVLLLSPWPESLYAYLPMWPRLAGDFSLLAVDLPGFGRSEGRPDLLSPRAMSEFVVGLIEEFGLRQTHAVGPDIGTSTLLFGAASHPNRFASIVVGAGAATFPLHVDGALKTVVEAGSVEPFRRTDPAEVILGSVAAIRNYDVPDFVRDDYVQSYAGERYVESMAYVRNYPEDLAALAPLLPNITTPVQILVGRDDPYGLAEDADLLNDRLRHSRLDILDTGHCAWEEDPGQYADVVSDWVSGSFRNA
jgi:pimeloyl-ACP methyl ester carboxylesterase